MSAAALGLLRLGGGVLGALLLAGAGVSYGAFVLYGARIDGQRQKLRDRGVRPVTTEDGRVVAAEGEDGRGD